MIPFVPPTRLLLGPGPSECSQNVLNALGLPLIGHLDPAFLNLMDETKELLRKTFQTTNAMTLPLSGTGSSGMEAALINVLEPNDRLIVAVNGVFGARMAEIGRRVGARVETVEIEWGRPVPPEAIESALKKSKASSGQSTMVSVVHAETSTGAFSPVKEIIGVARRFDAFTLVDCVTSLAGMPVDIDSWGTDIAYSGTQKCLSCPPGLAPFTISERAMQKVRSRTSNMPAWYLDLRLLDAYWGKDRVYHHTAPISMIYGLHAALVEAHDEGLPSRYERHEKVHRHLVERLDAIDLELLPPEGSRLPMLNAVLVPDGVDEKDLRMKLLHEDGIEVGGGLGPLQGKIIRIGLMGASCREENADRIADALKKHLRR